ncbi:hypothetical protein [Paenibacillus popilliae]|uniref:Uncharacterized protein n=1 Tax=Paenibacillus popilliae ATCC 14706 TaxID=1212764 RepID=M9LB40_PAEPP|nr:hypothetical protein [Paenibacillus popilliae]GAC43002.1 hypothetical protein PPOP_2365 [Paenibacillus popilliae ATCC 14706]
MDSWSNQACFGYVILAAEQAGFNWEQIKALTKIMYRIHDEVSVVEAAEHYRKSEY